MMLPDFNGRSAVLRPVQRPSRNWFPYLVAGALCLSAASAALAEEGEVRCMPTDQIISFLGDNFDEVMIGAGLHYNGAVINSLFVNASTGTWTVVVSGADGESCIVAFGDNWEAAPQGDPA